MSKILVVGSLNADLVVQAPRFPQPGETISGNDLQIIPGGKGANQAVAAARQGAEVAMVGRVGKDSFGPELINNLKRNHVDTSYVRIDSDSSTGTAIIVVDSNGRRSIRHSARESKRSACPAESCPGASFVRRTDFPARCQSPQRSRAEPADGSASE